MKSNIKLIAVFTAVIFCLFGCGGGGNSSSTAESSSNTPSSSPESSPPPSSSGLFSSISINPLTDLGLEAGNKVCFSVKSYNNFSESDFSKAICGEIRNDNTLTLSWNKITGDVSGYYVYFGANKNNATNFLADVMES